MYMLEMRSVAKVFRTEQVETHALRSLELQVKEGEFVAVTGPSGSGKTTFLNIAGLLETFTSGTYMLDGQDVSTLGDDARSRLRNQKIGFIFQGFNLIPDLNLFDNVDVPLRYRKMSANERRERIEKALTQVGLGSRMKHYPNELSGGQQQRVGDAGAPGCVKRVHQHRVQVGDDLVLEVEPGALRLVRKEEPNVVRKKIVSH